MSDKPPGLAHVDARVTNRVPPAFELTLQFDDGTAIGTMLRRNATRQDIANALYTLSLNLKKGPQS